MISSTYDDYTIAWICALPLEVAAARVMLNRTHSPLPNPATDSNAYELGELDGHYIIITCLPAGIYGTVAAANVVSRMRSTFPRLQYGLMVGIGGGVPGKNNDIRLGDVVVSKPVGQHGGVISMILTLLTHMSQLEAKRITRSEDDLKEIMEEALKRNPDIEGRFSPPDQLTDFLFESSYHHIAGEGTCEKCDKEQLVKRKPREARTPYIHYGLIASGNQVMKDSETRDLLALQHGILCFEMEAAGLMDELPTLVIRGICDYCDSHKQKQWQGYAALTAAAYAKVLLSTIPALPVVSVDAKLREYYNKNNRLGIKRLSGDLLDMQQCYINLSIIEYQHNDHNMQLQENSLSSAFSLLNRQMLSADNPEKEVTLPQLFHERKLVDGRRAQPSRILIRGQAGVGKTTLCKKIVHDFLHHQMWASLFDRIIWIPLRMLKQMSSLDEFFCQKFFPLEAERDSLVIKLRKTAFDQTCKKTLWLLDGLDEILGYRNPSGADLTEIFNSLLNEDNMIITSRPHAVRLSGLASFDLELETVGFHLHQVQTYLTKTITDPDIVNQIYSFIQSHWLIQGLVRIPIQLDALGYSWDDWDNDLRSGAQLQTMTAIYQAIELKLWKKDILNLEKSNNTRHSGEIVVWKLRTRIQIQSLVKTETKFLERLAFLGLYSDIIEFNRNHRDWLYEQPEFCTMSDDVLDRLSFLRTSDASDQDKSYHFLHLTFQEFFAAQYFVRCWISESNEPLICPKTCFQGKICTVKISPERFLQEEKYSGRYDVFWRFVTGLLYNINEEQVSSFLKKMEEEPRDLLGPAHQRLLMRCFSEVPQSENSGLAGSGDGFLLHLRETMERGCIQWSLYEGISLKKMYLCSETEFPEHVLCKLLQGNFSPWKTSHRKMILRALAHRRHMSFNLLSIITNLLDDGDWDVRCAALDALGKQSHWPPEVLRTVMSQLDDSHSLVRTAAIDALGKQSPWAPEILKAIMCRLDDSDSDVRWAVIHALGRQSPWPLEILNMVMCQLKAVRWMAIHALYTQSPWPPEIFEAVTCQLKANDSSTRQIAIKALSTQSPWPLEVFKIVMCQLYDSDWDVRCVTIHALSTQPLWPPEIHRAVTCLLYDSDWHIRQVAIHALGTQSLWRPEALRAVMCRLHDTDSDIREAAIHALSTQTSWSSEVLRAIMCRLDDSHSDVRRMAIHALGRQSPWSQEVFKMVMFRLDDSDWNVRQAAIHALGTQSPWPSEIYRVVMCQLHDSDSDIREAAIHALGAQSSWPLEIFKIVMCQLDDGQSLMRRAAIDALSRHSPWPPEVLRAVIYRLQDTDSDIREAAIHTLDTQSHWPLEVLGAVICQLDDKNSDVRRAAINTLGRQSPWPPEILRAVMCRLQDTDSDIREAAIHALDTQSHWPLEVLRAVMCQLDDDHSNVRAAAIDALSRQSPWPPEILRAVMCHLKAEDFWLLSRIENLLWKHDEFLSPSFKDADATSVVCKIWVRRSICELFACYIRNGNAYFETSDRRRSIPLSRGKIMLLKRALRAATVNSRIEV